MRRSCIVVSTSALHDRVLCSRPGPGMGMFDVKTWLSTLETVFMTGDRVIVGPVSLIGDIKEPLRTTCTLQASTLTLAWCFLGTVKPVWATIFHILLAWWANIVSDHFYPISHSHRSSVAYPCHPPRHYNTIKHNVHLI